MNEIWYNILVLQEVILGGIPLWQLVVTVVAALLVLLILILILLYFQCFKKKTSPQKEQYEQAKAFEQAEQDAFITG